MRSSTEGPSKQRSVLTSARWHRGDVERRWLRRASHEAKGGRQRKGAGGTALLIQLSTAKAKAKRHVWWQGIDSTSPRNLAVFVCFLFASSMGRAAVRMLDIAIDESKKVTAEGVPRIPNHLCGPDGNSCMSLLQP